MAEVAIASYPFTTIEANEGVGFVRIDCVESSFKVKCNPKHGFCIDGQRFVPVKLLDVAGLVPGASEGKGLGNKFLDDLRTADVLIHVVDAAGTTNEKGEQVPPGSYDPCNDIEFLEKEVDLWFVNIFKHGWSKFARQTLEDKNGAIAEQFSGLGVTLDIVSKSLGKLRLNEKNLRDWDEDDISKFATELRALAKPIIIAANKIDLPTAKENIEKMKIKFPNHVIVPCSAEAELALREAAKKELIKYIPGDRDFEVLNSDGLTEKQKKALDFVKEKILKVWGNTGVQNCLNTAVFDFLKYVAIYSVGIVSKLSDAEGNVLPDVFLMPLDSTPVDFANKIHTDLAEGYIKAIDAKTKKVISKDYKLKSLDVISIVSNK